MDRFDGKLAVISGGVREWGGSCLGSSRPRVATWRCATSRRRTWRSTAYSAAKFAVKGFTEALSSVARVPRYLANSSIAAMSGSA